MTDYSNRHDPVEEAKQKANTITSMIVMGFGNICAVSCAYFGFRNEFVMPLTAKVVMMFFIIWLIVTLLSHKVLKPFLEKRFVKKAMGQLN